MPFQPKPKQRILINGRQYTFAEHPNAPGIVYGQEGRQATVYRLNSKTEKKALKVFKSRFRSPALVQQSERVAKFAKLPGLSVCARTVISPSSELALLKTSPDLTYGVLMPWIEGETWTEIIGSRKVLTAERSLGLAKRMSEILLQMELNSIAHCDLSGGNLIISGENVELVDIEGMYSPDLNRPEILPIGSPGYAHRSAPNGLWSPQADRFAGAILLAEILGWCDERIANAAWGESYFNPAEMQKDGKRYQLIQKVLQERWGEEVGNQFARAWDSSSLAECPTFGEWQISLPDEVPLFSRQVAGKTRVQSKAKTKKLSSERVGKKKTKRSPERRSGEPSRSGPRKRKDPWARFNAATPAFAYDVVKKRKSPKNSKTRRNAGVSSGIIALFGISIFLLLLIVGLSRNPTDGPGEPTALICQVTDVGGIDDRSFNATAYKGVTDAEVSLGVEGQYLESQEQADYEANINAFVEQGCDLIVTVAFMGDATYAAADANPDQKFTIVEYPYTLDDSARPNLVGLLFATDQAAFLAGYVAAANTQTGTVGTFGGLQIPPVTAFMDGFWYGVMYYNEQKGTDVKVLGWDPSTQTGLFTGNFESTDDGRTFGENLMDEGADIIMPVAGPVGLGTAAAVQERGNAWIVGVDTDWTVSAAEYADVVLTSVLKNMDVAVFAQIQAVLDGTFAGGSNYFGTLANNGVGIAGSFPDLQTELDAIIAGINSGENPASGSDTITIAPGDPIHIAWIQSVTGALAPLGSTNIRGAEVALNDINFTLLGHPIQWDGEDSLCSTEGGQAAGAKIASDRTVVAVIGTTCSVEARGAMPLLADVGMIMISSSNVNPDLTNPEHSDHHQGYFRTANNDLLQGLLEAAFAYNELGLTRAATIRDGSLYAESLQQVFADMFTALGGTITSQEIVNVGDTDMGPVLTRIASGSPQIIYFPIFEPEGNFIADQKCDVTGLENTALMSADSLLSSTFPPAAGTCSVGMYLSGPYTAGSNYEAFLAEYNNLFGESRSSAPVFGAFAYDAMNLVLAAIEKVAVVAGDGTVTISRSALMAAMYDSKDFAGLTGNLSCDENGDCATGEGLAVFQISEANVDGSADLLTNTPFWQPGQ